MLRTFKREFSVSQLLSLLEKQQRRFDALFKHGISTSTSATIGVGYLSGMVKLMQSVKCMLESQKQTRESNHTDIADTNVPTEHKKWIEGITWEKGEKAFQVMAAHVLPALNVVTDFMKPLMEGWGLEEFHDFFRKFPNDNGDVFLHIYQNYFKNVPGNAEFEDEEKERENGQKIPETFFTNSIGEMEELEEGEIMDEIEEEVVSQGISVPIRTSLNSLPKDQETYSTYFL